MPVIAAQPVKNARSARLDTSQANAKPNGNDIAPKPGAVTDPIKREANGTFAKGHCGGPGRPAGRNPYLVALEEGCPPERFKKLVAALVQKAEDGDQESMRLIFKHLAPPTRLSPGIHLEGDLDAQLEQVRTALADGSVGASEAQMLIRLLLAQSTIQARTSAAGDGGLTAEAFTLLRAELKNELLKGNSE